MYNDMLLDNEYQGLIQELRSENIEELQKRKKQIKIEIWENDTSLAVYELEIIDSIIAAKNQVRKNK